MATLAAEIEAVASAPPNNIEERQALYNAAKKLMVSVENSWDTIYRVNNSPMILTFSHIAGELGIFKRLTESTAPITGTMIAQSLAIDKLLLGRILRFLASHDLIAETSENNFKANTLTYTLARPGFQAGIAHAFHAIMPCLQATPKFLADTKYSNPDNVLHSPFQIAHGTDKPAFEWALSQPKRMAEFNLWMSELHDSQKTWLDVFDFASHASNSSPDTLIFVDIGGGIGQQCALLKKVHPQVIGRIVLQDQPFVIQHAIHTEGVEKENYDIWSEQPHKGARVYYLRNILHDYPDEKATTIVQNTRRAMLSNSLLIIDEMIIPDKDAHQRSTEIDMIMMISLASIERTQKQWDTLLDAAGMRIVNKSTYNAATGESIIVAIPKTL